MLASNYESLLKGIDLCIDSRFIDSFVATGSARQPHNLDGQADPVATAPRFRGVWCLLGLMTARIGLFSEGVLASDDVH